MLNIKSPLECTIITILKLTILNTYGVYFNWVYANIICGAVDASVFIH